MKRKTTHFWRCMGGRCGNDRWMLWRRRESARDWISKSWRYYARLTKRR